MRPRLSNTRRNLACRAGLEAWACAHVDQDEVGLEVHTILLSLRLCCLVVALKGLRAVLRIEVSRLLFQLDESHVDRGFSTSGLWET